MGKLFIPSPQQQAVFDWVTNSRGSAVVIAVAGAGKTTTLTEAVKLMATTARSIFVGAFNKDIGRELVERVAGIPGVRAGTMHSAGMSACRRWSPDLTHREAVDGNKLRKLWDQLELTKEVQEHEKSFCLKLASLGKQTGVGPLWDGRDAGGWRALVDRHDLEFDLFGDGNGTGDDEAAATIDHAIESTKVLLRASIRLNKTLVDFDDMLYIPLFHNLKMFQNDWFLGDEWQDANAVRRALARKMLRPGGRAVFVGDPCQAIYGFTGADSDSLELTRQQFNAIELPLTVTYRCPKAVVRLANTWVSHIEAHDTAPEGTVRSVAYQDFLDDVKAKLEGAPADAILCRNVKPMIELAYKLIRQGTPVRVAGRDIGAGLIALASRWKVRKLEAMAGRLVAYRDREVRKWQAKGKETKAAAVEDKVDTLLVLIEACQSEGKHEVQDLVALIERLFSDDKGTDRLLLSTVHKAKGREWRRVYLLDRRGLMPSKWARQDWQVEQEANLCYVAVTRAKAELVEIDLSLKPRKQAEPPQTFEGGMTEHETHGDGCAWHAGKNCDCGIGQRQLSYNPVWDT